MGGQDTFGAALHFLIPAEDARDYGIVEPGAAINAAVRPPHAPYSATQACTTIVCSGYSLPIGRALRRRRTKESLMRKLLQGAAWAVWALALCVTAAHAQADFPSRPIKMYVPFPPGGGIDVTARIAAEKLSEILGQQIAIINQGGGGGAIATDAVVRADPDGYTLLYHSVTGITHAAVTENLSYDWLRDLAPVSLIARFAPVMIVSPTLPVKTMADFIALLKANPGKYSYGSSGTGTAVHLATELFKQKAGVDIVHVPYRGTVAVLPDLISGRVVMMIDGVPAETKNIQSGAVRALAVTTATRSPSIPDVPTMREVGLDYEVPFWTGLYAPIRTPQAIVDKLTAAAIQAMHDPAVTKRLSDIGTEAVGSPPAELDAATREQFALYRKIVRDNPALLSGQ
jgi:tripartite-type tricarboxylate transporter receptor subunit TctC